MSHLVFIQLELFRQQWWPWFLPCEDIQVTYLLPDVHCLCVIFWFWSTLDYIELLLSSVSQTLTPRHYLLSKTLESSLNCRRQMLTHCICSRVHQRASYIRTPKLIVLRVLIWTLPLKHWTMDVSLPCTEGGGREEWVEVGRVINAFLLLKMW